MEQPQFVEGFKRIVSAPAGPAHTAGRVKPGIDFRGYSDGWWTLSWWRRPLADTPPLVWETHKVSQKKETVFSFIGSSYNTPYDLYPPNRAQLFLDEELVLTFELGVRTRMCWNQGDFKLEFEPKRIQMPAEGYQRQMEMHGNSGIYRLTVPDRSVETEKPVRLRVELETPHEQTVSFFMIKDRQDTLKTSIQTNAEQIAQLQSDITQLQRAINAFGKRLYPELFPEILLSEQLVLFQQGRNHCNDLDIALAEDGEIMLAFRQAAEHIAPHGRLLFLRSREKGSVWRAEELKQFPWPSDIRVPVFHPLGAGRWLLTILIYHHYDESGERMKPKVGDHETYILRSDDNGASWIIDSQPLDPDPVTDATVMAPSIKLSSGRLLLPASSCLSDPPAAFLFSSEDDGKSWGFYSLIGEIPTGYSSTYPETTLALALSGRLIALIRLNNGFHFQSISEDEGRTWTPWQETPMTSFGHRARLSTLKGGEILCSYGWRCRRVDGLDDLGAIKLALSTDEGRSWPSENMRILRGDFLNWDIGYPVTIELPDGKLFTAYWGNHMERFYIGANVYKKWWRKLDES